MPSDICGGLRSSRQTSRPKDRSKLLYIVTSSIVFRYSFGFNQGLLTAGAVSSSSSDIVQDPTRVSRTVCVWLNVSTTPGNRCIYVQKWLLTGCWSDLNIGREAGRAVP